MYQKGFTHALRWDSWDYKQIGPYETALGNAYGNMIYNYDRSSWASAFGSSVGPNGYKPYFIYVRNESMLTVALLGVNA